MCSHVTVYVESMYVGVRICGLLLQLHALESVTNL